MPSFYYHTFSLNRLIEMLSVDDFYRIKLVCDHVRCFFDKSSLSFAECFAEFVRADIILALLLLRRKSGLSAAAALNPSRHLSEKEKNDE